MKAMRIIYADAKKGKALSRAYRQYIKYCISRRMYDDIEEQKLILKKRKKKML